MLHKTTLQKEMHQDVKERQNAFYEAIRGLMTTQQVSPTTVQPLSPSTDEITVLVPAVKKPAPRYTPAHVFRQHVHPNPLVMLFDAVVFCNRQLGRIPDALFVSKDILDDLQQETVALTGKPFDGHFRMFYPKAINGTFKMFPVFPEAALPDALRVAYGTLTKDSVIAIVER